MTPAPTPLNDRERLASLERMHLLSTPRMQELDNITRIAQKFFQVEISLISLVCQEKQWFKSNQGLDAVELPRDISFCGHAIHSMQQLVVEDTHADPRFADNPLVTGAPHIRFYAGQPLMNGEGHIYGTLCVMSSAPRHFGTSDRQMLLDLAELVTMTIKSRNLGDVQSALLESLASAVRDKMIDPLTGVWNRRGLNELFSREMSRAVRQNEPLAVGIIDIDNFKEFNDRYGHLTGDKVIKQAAEILVGCARSYDIVSRFGGDEFVIIASNITAQAVDAFADKIFQLFRSNAHVAADRDIIHYTISAGFSVYQPEYRRDHVFDDLLDQADQALLHSKIAGRNQYNIIHARQSAPAAPDFHRDLRGDPLHEHGFDTRH